MILLDSDDYLLTDADGNKALRDIVQFVPYREVSNDSKELFKQVMYELPQQLNDFMFRVGLEPRENY